MFSTITAQPDRQMRINTCGAGPIFEESFTAGFRAVFRAGFAAGLAAARRAAVLAELLAADFVVRRTTDLRAARRAVRLVDRLAVI
jgi:hypothetical protein